MSLLDYTAYDRAFFEENLHPYLPKKIIDCHTHIWKDEHRAFTDGAKRSCNWPDMVAKDNSIEDLLQTNRELFPGHEVTSVLYSYTGASVDISKSNPYVAQCAKKTGFPALYLAHPSQSADEVERDVLADPCFKGIKVYLEFAPSYIPNNEIRIYDFLTHEHLSLANKHHWIVQLHIPRPGRLSDPVNYVQMLEIEQKYPDLQLIIAHLGRAYANEDVGKGLDYLKAMEKTVWDFTANTNSEVMQRVLDMVGPERFIYGSDFPIFRMKARRKVENGFYVNEIPKGSLGDVSSDKHMRQIPYPDAEKITFFIYEEIASAIRACKKLGFSKAEIEKIFYSNSARIFNI